MKRIEKTSIILAASVAGLMLAGQPASADTWDGGAGDGEFASALNWNTDLAPNAVANTTSDINGAFTVTRSVDMNTGRTFVKGGATLNVTGGTHSDGQAGNTIRNFVGDGGMGAVNMSGGSYGIGHVLAIAHSSGSTGTFKLTGGDLSVFRGGNSLVGAYGGVFSLGHSISIGGNAPNTGVTGLFEISGGSLLTRVGVAVANNGTFSVVGHGATSIRLGGSGDDAGWFGVSSNGMFKAAVDAGGITPIFVEQQVNTSLINPTVEFQSGSLLDLSFVGAPFNGTWTLLELENADIQDGGLDLTAATKLDPNWSFNIDNSGPNGLLTATYVIPEPSTLALALCALGGLLVIRRKSG